MSRLSSSRLRLLVEPGALHATLSAGWLRPRALAEAHAACEDPAALAVTFDALMAQFGAATPVRGARLDVELANACVHFDVAEGVFAGHSEAQLGTVAAACVQELLGDAGAHELRWQLQPDERHLVICAIARPLVEPLRQAARQHGLRLRHLVPAFGGGWARHADALTDGLGVLAFSDGEQALAAFVRNGVIEAFSTGTGPDGPDDPAAPLPGVDRLLNGLGLAEAATPTRLDAQVARMVAGLGLDIGQIDHFVAVLEGDTPDPPSSRWMVFRDSGLPP